MQTHFKAVIAYDGTGYHGWQIQDKQATIQGELTACLKELFSCESSILGASRTDSGVHAQGQVAKISIQRDIQSTDLKNALNSRLSEQIRILDLRPCSPEFHPIADARQKTYHYYLSQSAKPPLFLQRFVSTSYPILDLSLMSQAIKLFQGQHDFQNFYCLGSDVKSTVRTIFHAELFELPATMNHFSFSDDKLIVMSFTGNGFLKQMVRLMVGALIQLGRGKIALADIEKALQPQKGEINSQKLSAVAAANGLHLRQIDYSHDD